MPIEVHVPIGFRLLKQVMVKIQYRFLDDTKMIEPLSESTPVYGFTYEDNWKKRNDQRKLFSKLK